MALDFSGLLRFSASASAPSGALRAPRIRASLSRAAAPDSLTSTTAPRPAPSSTVPRRPRTGALLSLSPRPASRLPKLPPPFLSPWRDFTLARDAAAGAFMTIGLRSASGSRSGLPASASTSRSGLPAVPDSLPRLPRVDLSSFKHLPLQLLPDFTLARDTAAGASMTTGWLTPFPSSSSLLSSGLRSASGSRSGLHVDLLRTHPRRPRAFMPASALASPHGTRETSISAFISTTITFPLSSATNSLFQVSGSKVSQALFHSLFRASSPLPPLFPRTPREVPSSAPTPHLERSRSDLASGGPVFSSDASPREALLPAPNLPREVPSLAPMPRLGRPCSLL